MNRRLESGAATAWIIVSIIFIVTTIAAAGVMIWALINYFDQKDNVDTKISSAVSTAKKEQADDLEAKFMERDKEPNRQFVGPDDYGRLMFDYPKTWSVFVESDASDGDVYEAYLNPVSVPPITNTTQFALRVTIETKDYDAVINSYDKLVREGSLKSSAVKADDQNGTRLEGNFTKDIRGTAVVFKIRDKTVTVRTDADTFRKDFDAIVSSITFNK